MAIFTVTLNPALDLTSEVEELVPNQKLRCETPSVDPGGGGVNVSRAIRILGGESTPWVTRGGSVGEELVLRLEEEGLAPHAFDISGTTRQSLAIGVRGTHDQYRFVFPGPEITEGEAQAIAEALRGVTREGDWIVLSGSLPPGLPACFYRDLAASLEKAKRRVIADTSGEALSAFLSIEEPPSVLRMNHQEAAELCGRPLSTIEDTAQAARQLCDDGVAQLVVLTHGDVGCILATRGQCHRIPAPKVERRSAVGAGDSLVGALTLGLSQDWELPRVGAYAMAAAASALTTPATDLCRRDQVEDFAADLERQMSRGASG